MPFELEQASYQDVYLRLVSAGLENSAIESIGQMIVSTDFMQSAPQVR
ncbi:MAG: hypothetical protein AAGA18_10265 [Verrucomicrobiota bacterium]